MTDTPGAGPHGTGPSRTIHTGDGVAWLRENPLPPTHAIVTSLPDASEMRALGFEGWQEWFVETAALVCASVDASAPAVFYQTDVKREGRWIDKAHLVAKGAEKAGASCLFHKVVCRVPSGTTAFGRPGYAHLLAFSRGLRLREAEASADVLPRLGEMTWSKAMGTEACEAACRFLALSTACRTVVDPFCGYGTVLAVANGHALDAIGVELSPRRARRARGLRIARADRREEGR